MVSTRGDGKVDILERDVKEDVGILKEEVCGQRIFARNYSSFGGVNKKGWIEWRPTSRKRDC